VAPAESGLTYVGHATVLAELAGVRLLTDPLLGGILHVRRQVGAPSVENLAALDAILISHAHHDHLDLRSLRRLAPGCRMIVPRGCAPAARRSGAGEVTELDEGDRVVLGGVVVEAVHAAHDGRRYPFGRRKAALGYLLVGPCCVYFAGDTDLFDAMSGLAGRVDVALLPIWGWGPRLPPGHLSPASAAQAVARIQPRVAIPIHWGTLKAWGVRGAHERLAPARAFEEAVKVAAPGTTVQILRPGERMTLRGIARSG
jgi:L-ascorbate metabolism protein UlaG (beta-lactamase superfamily)